MRKNITVIVGILIIAGAVFGYIQLKNSSNKNKKPKEGKVLQTVIVEKVKNQDISINITESGRLVAQNKVEVYAEVQGVMEATSTIFKPGARFKKGDVLVKIRNNDFYANLQAQKSVLQNLITSVLPDLKLDYPEAFTKWDEYLRNFSTNKPIGELPPTSSDKEKFFITGKNIYTTYYSTKNMEIVFAKYTIHAPFNGVLTDALVTPGTVIRPGQKLGEYIDPSVYEMEVSVSKSDLIALSIGKQVVVQDNSNGSDKTWKGTIVRINGKVETATQTVKVYIRLIGADLKEGMYMEAKMNGNPIKDAYEVSSSLLIDGANLFIVKDNKLDLVPVTILHKNHGSVVIKGLQDGMNLVSKPISGSYAGMEVTISNGK